jgi:hypothetical protein
LQSIKHEHIIIKERVNLIIMKETVSLIIKERVCLIIMKERVSLAMNKKTIMSMHSIV